MTQIGALFLIPPAEPVQMADGQYYVRSPAQTGRDWPGRILAVVLSGIVVLSPLPGGSNSAVLWMLWTGLIGLTGVFYLQAGRSHQLDLLPNIRILIWLGVCFVVYSAWQGMRLGFGPASVAPDAALLAAIRAGGYIGFFYLFLLAAQDRRRAKAIGLSLFFAIGLHAIFALIDLNLREMSDSLAAAGPYAGAATGGFVSKNSFATFLGLGLVLGLSMLRHLPTRRRGATLPIMERVAIYLCLLVITVALVNTHSRLGMTATIVGAILAQSLGRPLQWRAVLTLAMVAIAGVAVFGRDLLEQTSGLAQSATTRLDLYRQVQTMIAERPIFGFGNDSFSLAFQRFHAPPVTAEFVWDRAHSTYLTLWAELGLAFGSVPILCGALAAIALLQVVIERRHGRTLAVAGLAALGLSGFHSLADFSLEIQANMFCLLAIVALGLGQNAFRKETE